MAIQQMFLGAGGPKPAEPLGTIPVTSSILWYHDAFYITESGGQVSQLEDRSGNGRHITVSGGRMGNGIQQAEAAVGEKSNTKALKYIYNSNNTTGGIRWNQSGYWPGTSYTFMHIASFAPGASQAGPIRSHRIFDGFGVNWLSGFHSVGSGVYHHGNWVDVSTKGYKDHFCISIDRLNRCRSRGIRASDNAAIDSGYVTGAGFTAPSSNAGVGLNCGQYSGDINTSGSEHSDYHFLMAACYSGDIGDSNCNTLMNWAYNAVYG